MMRDLFTPDSFANIFENRKYTAIPSYALSGQWRQTFQEQIIKIGRILASSVTLESSHKFVFESGGFEQRFIYHCLL